MQKGEGGWRLQKGEGGWRLQKHLVVAGRQAIEEGIEELGLVGMLQPARRRPPPPILPPLPFLPPPIPFHPLRVTFQSVVGGAQQAAGEQALG